MNTDLFSNALAESKGKTQPSEDSPAGKRFQPLDGLRGIAILLVVTYHCWSGVPVHSTLDRAAQMAANVGWVGVDLFFVLSGFLIIGILYDHREAGHYFRAFYGRRALRTFPLYYLAVISLIVIPRLGGWSQPFQASPWWLLLHGSNILTALYGFPETWIIHFWSLSLEEQFYAVCPFLKYLRERGRMMAACGIIVGLCVLLRYACSYLYPGSFLSLFVSMPSRLDTFAIGGLLALWLRGTPNRRELRWLYLCAAAGVMFLAAQFAEYRRLSAVDWHPAGQAFNYLFLALVFAAFIGWSTTSPAQSLGNRFLSSYPLVSLGKFSYAIYIFHLWVDLELRNLGWYLPLKFRWWGSSTITGIVYTLLVLLLSSGIALIAWYFIERPAQKLKRHFAFEDDRFGSLHGVTNGM